MCGPLKCRFAGARQMQLAFTERFLRDFQDLPRALANKCREMIAELQRTDVAAMRQKALPGWRLHDLRGSNMMSMSVDMNYRALAQVDRSTCIMHRVVKHDAADRASVNRNDGAQPIATIAPGELQPNEVYHALCAFGVSESEAAAFRSCATEDDLLRAASAVSEPIAGLALTLYETSGLVIPKARFRVLHRDDEFARVLESAALDWQTYLHPSQAYVVEMGPSSRVAVNGSAGTGKTVCGWHRSKSLIDRGASVGFVCPHESVLEVSKQQLMRMVGGGCDGSFYLVAKDPDHVVQLADAVDHIIIDEAQEIPVTWLRRFFEEARDQVGVTLLYDINQLGGNIKNNDWRRYRRRMDDWVAMLEGVPRMQRLGLNINYRNAREIAEHYCGVLAEALPVKPSTEVPAFESGEVVRKSVKDSELAGVVASLIRQLLVDRKPSDVGVVTLDRRPDNLIASLATLKILASPCSVLDAVWIADASSFRGHERQVIIVTSSGSMSMVRNYGVAIDAYIAMSRAIKTLIVLEVA